MSRNNEERVLVNICLSIFVLTIALFLFEITLRIQAAKTHRYLQQNKYKNLEVTTTYSKNPNLIYTYIPKKYGINSQGYRDRERVFSKDKGVFRIIVIGDSIAEGLYVKPEERYSNVLQNLLNSSNNKKFEVIILARSGYSLSQELIILKEEAFKYSPDLIIWSYCLNDVEHPVFHNPNDGVGRYFFRPKLYVWYFISEKLFFINERMKSKKFHGEVYHNMMYYIYWDVIEKGMTVISGLSKEKNVPVIFLVFPIFGQGIKTFTNYPYASLHKKIDSLAVKKGLVVLDLLDFYMAYNIDEIRRNARFEEGTPYDSLHPNAKGHLIAAEGLYNKIMETNLVSKN